MQLTSVDMKEHDRFRALLEARENQRKAEVEARVRETGKTYLQHYVQYHAKIFGLHPENFKNTIKLLNVMIK